MANIFQQGSGKNSGKLTFKSLNPIFPIIITQSSANITLSSLAGAANAVDIPDQYIVLGTGTFSPGITYSTFKVSTNTFQEGIYGLNQIQPKFKNAKSTGASLVTNGNAVISKYSFAISACNNNITNTNNSIDSSIVIGGCVRKGVNLNSTTFINSKILCVEDSQLGSIISSYNNSKFHYICQNTSPVIISSKQFKSGYSIDSTIISSYVSCINPDLTNSQIYRGERNSIIGSVLSCVTGYSVLDNLILSSSTTFICGDLTSPTKKSGYKMNSLISSVSSTISKTSRSNIISSQNVTSGDVDTSIVSSGGSYNCGGNTSIVSSYSIYSKSFSSSIISSRFVYGQQANSSNTIISSEGNTVRYSDNLIISSKRSQSYLNNGNDSTGNTIISSYCSPLNINIFYGYGLKAYGTSNIISSRDVITRVQNSPNPVGGDNCVSKTSISSCLTLTNFLAISTRNSRAQSLGAIIGGFNNNSGMTSNTDYITCQGYGRWQNPTYAYTPHSTIMINSRHSKSTANQYSGSIIGGSYTCLVNTVDSSVISSKGNGIYAQGIYTGSGFNNRNGVRNSFNISSFFSGFANSNTSYWPEGQPSSFSSYSQFSFGSGFIASKTSTLFSYDWYTNSGGNSSGGPQQTVIIGANSRQSGSNGLPWVQHLYYGCSVTLDNLIVRGNMIGATGSICCFGVSGTFNNPNFICVVSGIVTQVG